MVGARSGLSHLLTYRRSSSSQDIHVSASAPEFILLVLTSTGANLGMGLGNMGSCRFEEILIGLTSRHVFEFGDHMCNLGWRTAG